VKRRVEVVDEAERERERERGVESERIQNEAQIIDLCDQFT